MPVCIARDLAVLVLVGLAATAAASVSWAAEDPLTQIVAAKDGASLCYQRNYDAAHLKQHPQQQTTEILLSFRYRGDKGEHIERVMLTRRDQQSLVYLAGSCDWYKTGTNIDTSGNRMIKSYSKESGYGCIALTGPGSAEEGGLFLIDLEPGGNSVTLHIDSPIYAMRGADRRGVGKNVELGRDDRVFRLQRTDAAACHALENALPDLP